MFAKDFPRRPMRGLIAIERDLLWQPALALERPPEKRFGRRNIPLGAEQKVYRLSLLVDRTVKISPLPFDLHIGFVDPPGCADPAGEAVPPLFEFRNIARYPAHDRRVSQGNFALGHHFHKISKAELEPQIPTHAEDNDLPVKLTVLEPCSASEFASAKGEFAGNMLRFCRLHQSHIEDLLAERGIIVTHETIRQWCLRFGQEYANSIRRRGPQPGDKWHLDEVFIKVRGETHYLWRAVDQDGNVLDILVQSQRNAKAATRFFKKLLKGLRYAPRVMITDKLASYGAARKQMRLPIEHRIHAAEATG